VLLGASVAVLPPLRSSSVCAHERDVISGRLQVRSRQDFGLWRDPLGQLERFKFGGARFAAVQRAVGSVRDRDEVVGAERLAASIAVELIAAGTERGAFPGRHSRRLRRIRPEDVQRACRRWGRRRSRIAFS